MLKVRDLWNPARASGYDRVNLTNPRSNKHWYRAQIGGSMDDPRLWRGPMRRSAAAAAQDYCDYVNGKTINVKPPLMSAGHQRPQQPKPSVPSDIEAARGMLRDYQAQQKAGRQGFVYCIGEAEETYAVKIGYSVCPAKRVPDLQTGNPRLLVLLGSFPGTEEDERRLHAKYAADNILQEWFTPSAALLAEFDVVR